MSDTPSRVADALLGKLRYHCHNDNCPGPVNTDDIGALDVPHDLFNRVQSGDIMPAGECPTCGYLVYSDLDTIELGIDRMLAEILRKQGYTVIEPKK